MRFGNGRRRVIGEISVERKHMTVGLRREFASGLWTALVFTDLRRRLLTLSGG